MARKDIGRKPEELDMLLSPSRGLQGGEEDEVSLRNPDVQARFRRHIDEKLRRWAAAHPPASTTAPEQRKRRDEELSIILLDLRKLREGITSIRRTDAFACEVYQASALLSLFASNTPQLSSSLPHLVLHLHAQQYSPPPPAASQPDEALASNLAALSLTPSSPADAATRAFFLTLHLLHSHLLPAFTSVGTPSTPSAVGSASPPTSAFLPTLNSLLSLCDLPLPAWQDGSRSHTDSHIAFLLSLYTALLRNSYFSLARLLSRVPSPPPAVTAHLSALHLPTPSSSPPYNPLAALFLSHAPMLRATRIWPTLEKAYRFPPDPAGWLSGGLLFEFEVRTEGYEGEKPKGESWEDDENQAEGVWREAARWRAVEWVRGRKGDGVQQ
ncbi:hypothetical protein JCM10213_007351 [Rhodosporidiobolus nylandii]